MKIIITYILIIITFSCCVNDSLDRRLTKIFMDASNEITAIESIILKEGSNESFILFERKILPKILMHTELDSIFKSEFIFDIQDKSYVLYQAFDKYQNHESLEFNKLFFEWLKQSYSELYYLNELEECKYKQTKLAYDNFMSLSVDDSISIQFECLKEAPYNVILSGCGNRYDNLKLDTILVSGTIVDKYSDFNYDGSADFYFDIIITELYDLDIQYLMKPLQLDGAIRLRLNSYPETLHKY